MPAAWTIREVEVKVPLPLSITPFLPPATLKSGGSMDVEPLPPISLPNQSPNIETNPIAPSSTAQITSQAHNHDIQTPHSQLIKAQIQPDGLLLYVAESSYEPGTSPLSSWVPITVYEHKDYEQERERDEGVEPDERREIRSIPKPNESPLSLFER